ncbi:MAG: 4Fe-4S dicluster domain-containing protein [Chloroflexi bacterium]|nr:4Fe-4S dicluster domain-containing protein [Chloroflexota bacterium]
MLDSSLRDWVNLQSHQNINTCFTCAKCTAGCPVAFAMEFGPHRILQMVRFGMNDAALASRDIWLCAGCETCATRCPNDVDVAALMDALRQISLAKKSRNPARDIADFHRAYLLLIKLFGRMHEASLMILVKLITRDLLADMGAGVQLVLKGKIPIVPERIRGTGEVSRMLNAEKRNSREAFVIRNSQFGNQK